MDKFHQQNKRTFLTHVTHVNSALQMKKHGPFDSHAAQQPVLCTCFDNSDVRVISLACSNPSMPHHESHNISPRVSETALHRAISPPPLHPSIPGSSTDLHDMTFEDTVTTHNPTRLSPDHEINQQRRSTNASILSPTIQNLENTTDQLRVQLRLQHDHRLT